ncbi:MAG: type III pantothenate kinase [Aggregatilineales bacterium]
MLLALDIGNTNVLIGLWDGVAWTQTWRVRTVRDKMPDEYAVLLRNFLGSFESIHAVAISSVVPSLTSAFTELCKRYFQLEPLVVSTRINTGIAVRVDQPEQVGADRIVNSLAAHTLYGGPAIVVDLGTATTFDVVARDGSYIGGSIAPGIGIARDALVGRTAQLYQVALQPPPDPIGRNTTHALQSGLFWGYVGLIEGLVARLRTAMPDGDGRDAKVIATGGLAPLFKEHTTIIDRIAPLLTLDGLRILYDVNQPNG